MMSSSPILAIAPVVGLIIALVIAVGLGVFMVRLWKLISRLIPRDCPYCASSDLVPLTRLSREQSRSVVEAASRLGFRSDMQSSYVCRSCLRVVDSAIMITAYAGTYWILKPGPGETRNPGEVIVYPPLLCRHCQKERVLSGGPKEYRVCSHCNAAHDWWFDEETGYSFFMVGKEDTNG